MKLADLFVGRPDFASKQKIIEYVRASKNFDATAEDLSKADALLIFSTSKQHTWLVASSERLYCVLDDIRKDEPHINWSIPRRSVVSHGQIVLPIQIQDKSNFTGLLSIGDARKDWMYTKRLFSRQPIEVQIKDLLRRTMLAQPSEKAP